MAADDQDAPKIYTSFWVTKWILDGTSSIQEMIDALKDIISDLEAMSEAGVVISGPIDGGMTTFETTDEETATRFGLREQEYDEDEDESYKIEDE